MLIHKVTKYFIILLILKVIIDSTVTITEHKGTNLIICQVKINIKLIYIKNKIHDFCKKHNLSKL